MRTTGENVPHLTILMFFFITKITMKIDDGIGRIKVQPFWQLQSLNLIIPKVTASRQKIELVTRLTQILLRSGVLSQ